MTTEVPDLLAALQKAVTAAKGARTTPRETDEMPKEGDQ